jgi:hypothetical protein
VLTVAIAGISLDHIPPGVVFLHVTLLPRGTIEGPVIGGSTGVPVMEMLEPLFVPNVLTRLLLITLTLYPVPVAVPMGMVAVIGDVVPVPIMLVVKLLVKVPVGPDSCT